MRRLIIIEDASTDIEVFSGQLPTLAVYSRPFHTVRQSVHYDISVVMKNCLRYISVLVKKCVTLASNWSGCRCLW